jgi:hypothetical protein
VSVGLPLLIGYKHAHGNELTFSPRVQSLMVLAGVSGAGSAGVYGVGVGASLGYSLRLGERFSLMPELAFAYPVVVAGTAGGAAGLGSSVVQFKLGVAFGKQRAPSSGAP